MTSQARYAPEKLNGSRNPLTQWVRIAALGRYGTPALANPWNGYQGDYSDQDIIEFGLGVRQDWLDKDNVYLMPHAIAFLARNCKDMRLRELWRHIQSILPCSDGWVDEPPANR